jgi:antitoxin component YwqK of YwqJK toxin-antitoxin module
MARYPASWAWPLAVGLVFSAGGSAIRAQVFSAPDDDEPAAAQPYSYDELDTAETQADTQADEPAYSDSSNDDGDNNDAAIDETDTPADENSSSAEESAPAEDAESVNIDDQTGVELIQERYPNREIKIEREVTQDPQGNYINHGLWKMWDPRGNVVAEGHYRDGERHGTWTRWYRSGEAELFSKAPYQQFTAPFVSQATFENGKLQGKWLIYDSKQRKISEWDFAAGNRNGKMIWYFLNGKKMREIDYRNGEIDGQLLEWNLDNKLVIKDTYQGGRKLASKTDNHTAGHKKSEGMYLHAKEVVETPDDWWNAKLAVYTKQGRDEKHGEWTSWYANGQKQLQGAYENDAQVGKFVWWHENGQKALEGSYDHGKQNGKWTWWHNNGQKSIQGRYVKGNPTGRWVWWREDGKVAQAANLSHAEGDIVEMPKVQSEASKIQPPPRVRFKR